MEAESGPFVRTTLVTTPKDLNLRLQERWQFTTALTTSLFGLGLSGHATKKKPELKQSCYIFYRRLLKYANNTHTSK